MDARTAFLSTRPWSFTMTFSSVTLGTLIAALQGRFSPLLYGIALAGMIAFHAATNVLNDFYDVSHGVDKGGAPTTRYRLHPAAFGQTPLSSIVRFSAVLYILTLLAAAYLAYVSSYSVLVVVGAGVFASVFYTADPVVLKAHALGEATVFAMWGILIPLGAYMVQTGSASLSPIFAAGPVGVFVALVLLANNIRDIEYDGSVNTRTAAVVLGATRAEGVYVVLLAATYLYEVLGVLAGFLPPWSLLVLLTVPEALRLTRMFRGAIPDDADPRTAALALRFALLYMLSLIMQIAVPVHLHF